MIFTLKDLNLLFLYLTPEVSLDWDTLLDLDFDLLVEAGLVDLDLRVDLVEDFLEDAFEVDGASGTLLASSLVDFSDFLVSVFLLEELKKLDIIKFSKSKLKRYLNL